MPKKHRPAIILVILILFQFILISFQIPFGEKTSFFERLMIGVFSPVKHGTVAVFHWAGSFWENYFSFRSGRKENIALTKDNMVMRQENLYLKNILKKYQSERDISEQLESFHSSILIARIVGFDLNNLHKSVLIDRGIFDKIRKNMVVLDRYGNLIGRIFGPVSFTESRVQLITDSDMGIGVYAEKDGTFGVLKGAGKGMCRLDYILRTDEDVQVGQAVFTTGIEGIFPKNLPVGQVIQVDTSNELFKTVWVSPYYKFNDLDRVVVLKEDLKDIY
ncbi:rod shape-determining protein MreC [Acidobacteriota bacterium]